MSVLTPRINDIDTRIDNKDVKNVIINGGFDFWQRGTSFNYTGDGTNLNYAADRFRRSGAIASTSVDFDIEQSTDVPSNIGDNVSYSLKITNNIVAADAIDVNDEWGLVQVIERNIMQNLIGKKVKISFWAKASSSLNLSFTVGYGVNPYYRKVNEFNPTTTWQKFEFTADFSTVVSFESTGTSTGAYILFELYNNFAGRAVPTEGEYIDVATDYRGLETQDNFFGTIGNELYLAGFMMTEDTEEPDFAPDFKRAGRNYQEELQLCQRYYEKSYDLNTAPGTVTSNNEGATITLSSTDYRAVTDLKISKRTVPAVTLYSPVTGSSGVIRIFNSDVAKSASSVGENAFNVVGTGSAVRYVTYQWSADAEL